MPLTLALTAYCVLNEDWMGQLRFSTPVWPLAILATAVCAARLIVKPGLRRRIGLVGADPRMVRDYVQINPSSPDPASPWGSSDWIRRSALRDPSVLAKLRAYANLAVSGQGRFEQRTPDGECSDRLKVGESLTLH